MLDCLYNSNSKKQSAMIEQYKLVQLVEELEQDSSVIVKDHAKHLKQAMKKVLEG